MQAFLNGNLGFVPLENVVPEQSLAATGTIGRDEAGEAQIKSLLSLQLTPGMKLVKFSLEASPLISRPNVQERVADINFSDTLQPIAQDKELATPVISQFTQEQLATPRATSSTRTSPQKATDTPEMNNVSPSISPSKERHARAMGLDPAAELNDSSPGLAISGEAPQFRSTPSRSQYRPGSVRTSLLLQQSAEPEENKEVWSDWVKSRDPTMSIYDAYFRPSMYLSGVELDDATKSARLIPQDGVQDTPSEYEANFDISIESTGSNGYQRGVDTILPPVQGSTENRLLDGTWSESADTSSIPTTSQRASTSSYTPSSAGVPIANMEDMHQSRSSEMTNYRTVTPQDSLHPKHGYQDGFDTRLSPQSTDRYARSRSSNYSGLSQELGATKISPPRSLITRSPQRRMQQPHRTSEDRYDAQSMGTSRASSSFLGSPLTKRSLDCSVSPSSSDAALFQRWTTLLTDRNGGSRALKKARQLVEIGVPTALRGRVWLLLAEKNMQAKRGVFQELCERSQESITNTDLYPFSKLIEHDLDNCFPLRKPFLGLEGSTRDDIRLILHAFAFHNAEVGYTEGMCLIVGLLLTHVCVEDAFWLLDAVVSHYGMQGCYVGNMEQLHVDNAVVDELLRLSDESLHQRLKDLHIEPIMFLPGWVLPLFVRTLPWPTLLRFWDHFLCHGYTHVLRTAVAIIRLSRPTLLNSRLCPGRAETLHHLVFVASPPLSPDSVLEHAREVPITDKELTKMQRNATKLVRQNGPTTLPIESQDTQRPSALQGKPVSRGTIRLLAGRRKTRT